MINVSVSLLNQVAKRGNVLAQRTLADVYRRGLFGQPQDKDEGARWYRRAAERGDAISQIELGVLYEKGLQGHPPDYAAANHWFRKAAARGYARAQAQLGYNYVRGRGVPQSDNEAFRWYRKAAAQGAWIAQYDLYDLQCRISSAKKAESGDASAQHELGIRYSFGLSVPEDRDEAAKWFERAASQGYSITSRDHA